MMNLKSQINLLLKSKNVSPDPQSMHNSMSFVLVLVQLFGVMPVYGIRGRDHNNIKFKWISFRFFYAGLALFGAFTCILFCLFHSFIIGFMLDKTATMSFYICNFWAALYFVKVAKNWNHLIREWAQIESSMKSYGYPALKRRFKVMAIIVFTLALIEHLLFVLNALNTTWKCKRRTAKIYFTVAFPHVFQVVTYAHWKAVLIETVNILTTFWWNFLDLFIMLLSSALALRFQQVSKRIQTNAGANELFWKKVRDDYNRLAHLCSVVDKHIGALVGISFISNLFFICIQLYNSFKPRYGVIPSVYFFYSFGFLLARTLAVSMYSSWINDESREPLKVLHSIPSENYCTEVEIERFVQQIHTDPNGLTGSKFFFVSRLFILKLAGTIVTFELMLLQFGPLLDSNINLQVNHHYDYVEDCKIN